MTFRPAINLAQPQTTIGFNRSLAGALHPPIPAAPESSPQGAAFSPVARSHGVAEALTGTPTVESGNVIEAIAAALEGGLHGRSAMMERQAELDAARGQEMRAEKEQARTSDAYSEALRAGLEGGGAQMDPTRRAMIEALMGAGEPRAAFDLFTDQQQTPPEFTAGPGYTHAFRVDPRTGQVVRGGELPLRPRAAQQGLGDYSDEWEAF